jgi:hypothetical protein
VRREDRHRSVFLAIASKRLLVFVYCIFLIVSVERQRAWAMQKHKLQRCFGRLG